ncbi:MAG: hypothetical protein WC933_01800 [Candidatus Paceibacterota bacterium]|jgi:hypothetical protein
MEEAVGGASETPKSIVTVGSQSFVVEPKVKKETTVSTKGLDLNPHYRAGGAVIDYVLECGGSEE